MVRVEGDLIGFAQSRDCTASQSLSKPLKLHTANKVYCDVLKEKFLRVQIEGISSLVVVMFSYLGL